MLNENLSDLYLKYHPEGLVITGGVMNEDEYLKSRIKIMMLMKEVNDISGRYDWNLPGLLSSIYERKQPFYRIWKNVSRWAICAQTPEITFEEISKTQLYEGLKIFATTNLKKTGGSGKSDYNEILEHARKNKDEWISEIEILDPEMIVCSGTFDIVKKSLEIQEPVNKCNSGAPYFISNGRLYLDFVHPAYQISDKLMYAFFKETFNNLLIQEGFHNY